MRSKNLFSKFWLQFYILDKSLLDPNQTQIAIQKLKILKVCLVWHSNSIIEFYKTFFIELKIVSKLLELDESKLHKALTERTMEVSGQRITIPIKLDQVNIGSFQFFLTFIFTLDK